MADEALAIAARLKLDFDSTDIEAAAMLHDIGIVRTNAPGIGCYGSAPYLCHGPIGADLLRAEGAPEAYALVAERHTGAGLTPYDIDSLQLPMPAGGYICLNRCLRSLSATPTAITAKAAICDARDRPELKHLWQSSARIFLHDFWNYTVFSTAPNTLS